LIDLAELGQLAPDDLDARQLGAPRQARLRSRRRPRVGRVDREVVDHRDRRAPTQITSFTFIATQSMPTVSQTAELLGHHELGATPSVLRAIPVRSSDRTTLA
jgi:hypothetical protein